MHRKLRLSQCFAFVQCTVPFCFLCVNNHLKTKTNCASSEIDSEKLYLCFKSQTTHTFSRFIQSFWFFNLRTKHVPQLFIRSRIRISGPSFDSVVTTAADSSHSEPKKGKKTRLIQVKECAETIDNVENEALAKPRTPFASPLGQLKPNFM